MHTHDFCGEKSTNLHTRDIGKLKNMHDFFFVGGGGGHLGAPRICGGTCPPGPRSYAPGGESHGWGILFKFQNGLFRR